MLRIDSVSAPPEAAEVEFIARSLSAGGIALLPTDTIYGLHAVATDSDAIRALWTIKGRSEEKPLVVLFSSVDQLVDSGAVLQHELFAFLSATWPAPLTAVIALQQPIAATAGRTTVAARIPDLPWLRELIGRTGPLASSSANRSGEPPATDLDGVGKAILNRVAVAVDAGPIASRASTLVDFCDDPPKVLRKGEFVFRQNLWKTMRKTL